LSRVISIFLDCLEPIERLESQLEPILSVHFKELTGKGTKVFEARTRDSVIAIRRHDFENDRDLNFEDYSYEIQIRPIRDQLYDLHERRTLSYARSAFAELKSVLKCNMMLVDDLQHKLDEYHLASTTPNY
jgi:hypothetical protein